MSLHLQTEKLKSITFSWQPSTARLRRPPPLLRPRGEAAARREGSPDPARGSQPAAAAPIPIPLRRPVPSRRGFPPPPPFLPSRDPPAGGKRRRGSSAATRTTRPGEGQILLPAQAEVPGRRRSQRPPRPVPVAPGGRGTVSRPRPPPLLPPRSAGPRGRRRAGAGWKLTWGWRNSNIWGLKRWTSPAQFGIKPSRLPNSTSRRRRLASALPWSQAAPSPSPEPRQLRRAASPHLSDDGRVGARYPNSRDDG